MNFLKKKNTMLYKLSLSYILVILFATVLTGILANVILEYFFNRQTVSLNEVILNEVGGYISKDILNGVDRVYLNLASDSEAVKSYTDSFSAEKITDYRTIKNIINIMTDNVVAESSWLSGMYTYFADSGVLVGTDGFIYNKNSRSSVALPEWMNEVLKSGADKGYIPTGKFASQSSFGTDNACLIIKKYPLSGSRGKVKGYVIFKINEETFSNILKQSKAVENGAGLMIADYDGNIISSTEKYEYPGVFEDSKVTEALNGRNGGSGYIECDINGMGSVVSYAAVKPYGWRLISISSKGEFYRAAVSLRLGIVIICVIAVILGLLFSNTFKKHIYSPVRNIVETIGADGENINEYAVINGALSNMTYRINSLEGMLDSTRPAARKELVTNLIYGKALEKTEWDKLVKVSGCKLTASLFTAVIFRIDRDLIDNLNDQSSSQIIKHIINEMENLSDRTAEYIGCDLDKDKIVLIAGYENANMDYVVSDIGRINKLLYVEHYLSCVALIGSPAAKLPDIQKSYERAEEAGKYTVFMGERSVIYADEVLLRDKNPLMLDERILDELKKHINNFDAEKIRGDIHKIIRELEKNDFSAAYCNNILLEIMSMLSSYVKSNNYKSSEIMDRDMISVFSEMNNIYEYEEFIFGVVEKISELSHTAGDSGNTQIVEKAKEYINNNLEKDLSLTLVAEKVYISSQYLCKIFKEETGMNFIDYITVARMERAKELLLETNMNIESIAEAVGYKTPHYFTKKFKERFGVTPKNFRLNN